MNLKRKRAVVAMSGGVDSSVAALLLVHEGYEVVGVSMRLWLYEKGAQHGCCTPEDLYDARRVADALDIPHYVFSFEATFERDVVEPFVQSYAAGETPNPCVRCNQSVKFTHLLRRAQELGAEFLATGHYARRSEMSGGWRLLRAVDRARDQSYFLYGIRQNELAYLRFPIGSLSKDEVRKLAREANLPVADKPDSQEICFVPDSYSAFVEKRLAPSEIRTGAIIREDGVELGTHSGIHQFTVGQRRGLGLAEAEPLYVLAVHPGGNIMVGPEASLRRDTFDVGEPRWVVSPPSVGEELGVQIRSRFEAAPARLEDVASAQVRVRFREPQRAITPGQAAVFYRGEEVVGGGWIRRVHSP